MQPLTLGRLLDKAFRIAVAVLSKLLLPIFFPLALLNALFMMTLTWQMWPAVVVLGIITTIVGFCALIWISQIVYEHWKGNSGVRLQQILGQASFRKARALIFVSLMVGLGTVAGPLLGFLFGALLGFALSLGPLGHAILFVTCTCIGCIPAFIFYINRILAPFIVILENQKGIPALNASKSLMTRSPRFQRGSPFLRLGGISICIWVISIAISLSAQATLSMLISANGNVALLHHAINSLISSFTNTVVTATYIGFYCDLLARYEATDILSNLERLRRLPSTIRLHNFSSNQPPAQL